MQVPTKLGKLWHWAACLANSVLFCNAPTLVVRPISKEKSAMGAHFEATLVKVNSRVIPRMELVLEVKVVWQIL
eukprot:5275591-Amphidinium_carterae.1